MNEKIFQLDWGTGNADIKIAAFFTSAKAVQLKKFCKLARLHSTEDERTGLLAALVQEDKAREALLDKPGELSYEKSKLANSFFHTVFEPEQGWAEKRLLRERAQLKKAIDTLTEERWGV